MTDDIGVFISTKGNNANEQSDKNSAFSSNFSTIKIFDKGNLTFTTNGSGIGSKRILHGLGYPPAFRVFRHGTASFSFLDGTSYTNAFFPDPGSINNWTTNHNKTACYADETFLTVYIEGAASTKYDFTYFIFIDEAKVVNRSLVIPENDLGIFVSKPGKEANSDNEYEKVYSSNERALRYFPELTTDHPAVTLPFISGDAFDQTPQEGTYVDFFHRLGYPPYFLAYAQASGSNNRLPIPVPSFAEQFGEFELSAWCDKSRIRITFSRKANFDSIGSIANTSWDAQSFSFKLFIFEENLGLSG